jgi:peptidyl-prolyl cis-trans isomerase B (cyclophilin B)
MKSKFVDARSSARLKRKLSIISRKPLVAFLMLWLLPLASCGRRNLTSNQLGQNRFFSEILKRESSRNLGDDNFFEQNLFSNPYPEVRRLCAISLGRIGDRRALPLLYSALHKGDAMIRAASAFSIGAVEDRRLLEEQHLIMDPRTLPELTRLLDDTSLLVRMRAVEALGRTGSQTEAIMLAERLKHFSYSGTPEERAYLGFCIAALIRLNDPVSYPLLEKFAALRDPEIQSRSLNALARLRDPAREVRLIAAGDPSPPSEPLSDAVCIHLAANRYYPATAILETTRGDIEIELFQKDAPVTTERFMSMAVMGAFKGLHFAKADSFSTIEIEEPRLKAGPSLNIGCEINMHPFEKGSVGMALTKRLSQSDRLFIALAPQPDRDGVETCFGRIISGMQAAEKIVSGDYIKKVQIKKNIGFLRNQKF